jgi:outer membrane immunogenic protein
MLQMILYHLRCRAQGSSMPKYWIAGIAAVVGTALATTLPAIAADMPVKAPAVMSPTWTGFYVGASLGARWATNDWQTSDIGPNFGAGAFVPTDGTGGGINSVAARFGGYLGYNWQVANAWVTGLEADFGWANNSKTANPVPGTVGLFFGGAFTGLPIATVKTTWDGSVRGRLGYLIAPTTLLYGTGGVAWQSLELNANCSVVPGNSFCFGSAHYETSTTTRVGWTIGGGVEHMIGRNWVARVDYRYADFGSFSQVFFSNGVGIGFDDRFTAHLKARTHTATVGLAYKF